jgi:hypothetical protein
MALRWLPLSIQQRTPAVGPNDFTVAWNGQTELALANKSAQGYTEYSFTATGTAGTSHLEFDARQDPSHWSLDNVSVVAVGSQPSQPLPAAPAIASAASAVDTVKMALPKMPTPTPTKPLELTDLQTHSNTRTIPPRSWARRMPTARSNSTTARHCLARSRRVPMARGASLQLSSRTRSIRTHPP